MLLKVCAREVCLFFPLNVDLPSCLYHHHMLKLIAYKLHIVIVNLIWAPYTLYDDFLW